MTQQPDGQLTLFDPDTCAGKMCRVPFQVRTEKISERFSRKSAELSTAPYLYLDLRTGHGSLLGPLWETNSPSLGEFWTLNTGPAPRKEGGGSTLSQILEASPPAKYYLSKTTCLGILRRAKKRGKELPPVLKQALEIQAGIQMAAEDA